MRITKNNYETFAVDFLDGKLNAAEKAMFILFLEEHSEIKAEFEELSSVAIAAENIVYEGKENLMRNPNSTTPQQLLIKKIENDLTDNESKELTTLLEKNKNYKNELILFQKTISKPDLSVVFQDKESLKRNKKGLVYYWYYAAAAALILAVVLPFAFKNSVSTKQNISNNSPIKVEKTKNKNTTTPVLVSSLRGTKQSLPINQNVLPRNQSFKKLEQITPLTFLKVENKSTKMEVVLPNKTLFAIIENPLEIESFKAIENYPTLKELAALELKKSLRDVVVENNNKPSKQSAKLTKWDGLAFVIKTINKVTGKKTELKKTYNTEGELTQYAIVSKNFSFSKSLYAKAEN